MKKVCPRYGSKRLHKHGGKRRKCMKCEVTFSIKSGRKRRATTEKYILDRSTFRRIATKLKCTHQEVIRKLHNELKYIPTPLSHTKNFTQM